MGWVLAPRRGRGKWIRVRPVPVFGGRLMEFPTILGLDVDVTVTPVAWKLRPPAIGFGYRETE